MIRRAAHLLLAAVGIVLWALLALGACALVALAVLGHRIWPQADRGDCWTYALPRWALHGGGLRITISRVGWLRIPRAAWIRLDGVIERAEPVARAHTAREALWGLRTLYFRYRVRRE